MNNVSNKKIIKKGSGIKVGINEYFSRKEVDCKKNNLEYYFSDLLISIYGEDIFSSDLSSNYQINQIIQTFDQLLESEISLRKSKGDKLTNIIHYFESIMYLYHLMIVEYQQCECPKIDETSFIEKLEDFLSNKDYIKTFELSEKSPYPFLRNALIGMIETIKNSKIHTKKESA